MTDTNLTAKAKWLTALRSGEYNQSKFTLRDYSGFCCLGVLCDVYSKETGKADWEKNPHSGDYRFLEGVACLPQEVGEWIVPNADASFGILLKDLADMNDYKDKNFSEIADIIEERL